MPLRLGFGKPSKIGLVMATVERACKSGFKLHFDVGQIDELLLSWSMKLGVLDDLRTPTGPSVIIESPKPTGIELSHPDSESLVDVRLADFGLMAKPFPVAGENPLLPPLFSSFNNLSGVPTLESASAF